MQFHIVFKNSSHTATLFFVLQCICFLCGHLHESDDTSQYWWEFGGNETPITVPVFLIQCWNGNLTSMQPLPVIKIIGNLINIYSFDIGCFISRGNEKKVAKCFWFAKAKMQIPNVNISNATHVASCGVILTWNLFLQIIYGST